MWISLLLSGSLAAPVQTDRSTLDLLEASTREVQLENGWRFLLLPRPGAPVVSFETRIDAGSAADPPGQSGLATLVAHGLLAGSDRVGSFDWNAENIALVEADRLHAQLALLPKGTGSSVREPVEEAFRAACSTAQRLSDAREFRRGYEEAGASLFACEIDADASRLRLTLPSSRIELFFWMERERLTRPALRTFYSDRDARLLRDETIRPQWLVLHEELAATAFRSHPYGQPSEGFPGELAGLSREDAYSFVRARCGARHLVTAIVGNFDPDRVVALIERYGSAVSSGPASVPLTEAELPQRGERRVEIVAPLAPWVGIGWRVPGQDHPDSPALQAACELLFGGKSARVPRRLADTAAEFRFDAGVPGKRSEHLAVVLASPLAGVSPGALELAIEEEVERLARDGPDAFELEGLVRGEQLALLTDVRNFAALATRLVEHQTLHDGWRSAFHTPERLAAVTPEAIRIVTRRYLRNDNRSIVHQRPPHTEEPAR